MRVSKTSARKQIKESIQKIVYNRSQIQEVVLQLHSKYGIAIGDIMDYISGQTDVNKADTFTLFVLASGIDEILEHSNIAEKIFTEVEIKEFSLQRIEPDELEFPIRIKCIQINDDQWIGMENVKFLMKLRDAQKINYNTNAQRAMKRIVRGGNEFYRISINNAAVKKIKDLLKRGVFIPNTITLNIPMDSDYSYNSKKNELVIRDLKYFDIADGYHRYLAMSQLYSEDSEFDYPIEIRIISFSDDKIKQFIFQEDQKTRMRKIDSDSMNMDSASNIVAERLNRNIMFNWHGQMSRGGSNINISDFASMVNYFYYRNKPKEEPDSKFIMKTEAVLIDKLNPIIAQNEKLIDNKVNFKSLLVLFYCITSYDDATEHIRRGLENLDGIKTNREINARVIREVSKLVE